jgi:hypothetical protein
LSIRDFELWLFNLNVMLLIIYDAKKERAFYIDLNEYFQKNNKGLLKNRKFVRIYIPSQNTLDVLAVKLIRINKNLFHGNIKNV